VIGLLALAAQLSIVAHAPDSAAACDAIEVTVAVSAPGREPPRLVAPSFAPFDVLRSSTVPHVVVQNGGAGMLAEYRFVLTTDRVGTYTLPAFTATRGVEVARSRPLDITVHGAAVNRPVVVARARIDTSLAHKFRAISQPETVYVGQQANYEVAVFLNQTVRDRLRRNPTFFPPDMQSMLAYDLPARTDPPRRQGSSGCFDALVYQRALFPLMPGRFSIPPAQLVYSLPLSASFFSRFTSSVRRRCRSCSSNRWQTLSMFIPRKAWISPTVSFCGLSRIVRAMSKGGIGEESVASDGTSICPKT
jgi:hypothetical protein